MNTPIKLLSLFEIFFIIKAENNFNYCDYYDTSSNLITINFTTNDSNLCFLYSNTSTNTDCCHDSKNSICVKQTSNENSNPNPSDSKPLNRILNSNTNTNNYTCPKKTKTIKNNCGIASLYEPAMESQCTGISLVEAYCCFVKIEGPDANNACLRSKKFVDNDKHKKNIGEINKVVGYYGNDYKVVEVKCYGEWKIFNILLYSFIIFILF